MSERIIQLARQYGRHGLPEGHGVAMYGRPFRLLRIVDEYTRKWLAIDVERKLSSESVL